MRLPKDKTVIVERHNKIVYDCGDTVVKVFNGAKPAADIFAEATKIVAIGSMAGWMPVSGRAAYCGAKSALAQSFEVLRCEEQRHAVHVLMVYPGFLDTAIERNALGHDGDVAQHDREIV